MGHEFAFIKVVLVCNHTKKLYKKLKVTTGTSDDKSCKTKSHFALSETCTYTLT